MDSRVFIKIYARLVPICIWIARFDSTFIEELNPHFDVSRKVCLCQVAQILMNYLGRSVRIDDIVDFPKVRVPNLSPVFTELHLCIEGVCVF